MKEKRYRKYQRRKRFLIFSLTVFIILGVFYIKDIFHTNLIQKNNVIQTYSKAELTKEPEKTTTPTVIVTNEPEQKETDINLSFVGDILLSEGVLTNYDKEGINGVLSKSILSTLRNADITMANEEFPFSVTGTKMKDKQFTFRINPRRVGILNQMGIDIVTLANNHALDYGRKALQNTFETLDNADISFVGAGKDSNRAKQIEYRTVNNVKLAYIAASRVIPVARWNAGENSSGMLTTYDPAILLEQIKTAEKNADYTIVYVHWGIERNERPEKYQRELAKKYINAGADIIIGSHPHCLQGIEFYKKKPIVYSLGNFVFGTTISRTAVLKVKLNDKLEPTLSVIPCEGTDFYTKEIKNKNRIDEFYKYLQDISYQVLIDKNGIIKEN